MILITRPLKHAISTQQELEFRGSNSVVYPLLEIYPVHDALPLAGDYDAVIITSQNAAEMVRNDQLIKTKPLFLVGDESALILKEHNIASTSQDAAELILKVKTYPYKKILYLSGDHVSTQIDQVLKEEGFDVERKIVYQSIAVTHLPKDILEFIRHILFYSARTAETFAKLIGHHNLSKCKALCISQKTADQIKHLNWQEIQIAEKPNENSLLSLLPLI